MSTLRKDPVSNSWVIIAADRARRPSDFAEPPPQPTDPAKCPFCPGNEGMAPAEIVSEKSNSGEWIARVIPNKFAALHVEGDLERRGVGMYDEMNGIGAHEVLIESRDHHARMHNFSDEQIASVLRLWHGRVCDLSRDIRFRYIQIFRNFGPRAGASLEHPHSQIMALPIVPRWVKEELACAKIHWERTERCVFCDIIDQERHDGDRVVFENDHYIAFCPFAAKFPFETWILPRHHGADVRALRSEEIVPLGEVLRRALGAIAQSLSEPPYNLILHSAPFSAHEAELLANTPQDYHWHIEIIPRLTIQAGFEWGTGFHINPVPPEQAASHLREALENS